MGIFTMSYIWEQPNKGNTLYEMAIIKQKSLMEAPSAPGGTGGATGGPSSSAPGGAPAGDKVKIKIADGKDNQGTRDTITGVLEKFHVTPTFDNGCVEMTKEESAKCSAGIQYLAKKDFLVPTNEMQAATASSEKTNMENNRAEVVKSAIEQFKNKDIQNELALAVRCLMNGVWFDGKEPDAQQKQKVEQCQTLLKTGKPEQVLALLRTITGLEQRGVISIDPSNPHLYKENSEKTQFNGDVKMPPMFDAEPDDSMWNEMIINEFGMPIINLSHPAVAKIIKSDNPEEDCPAELKEFKKAVYGDKRLTAVFGEGGISRVILGKMANLLTLGIAGATLDAGKRADRIIKELQEKGGHIAHRNLLFIGSDELMDADADNEELKIPSAVYNRSKKKVLGSVDVPAPALAQFYSAVDPIKSAKIYLEILASDDKIAGSLNEAVDADGNALLEGKGLFGKIAGAARSIQDKITGDKAENPSSGDSGKLDELKKKWVSYLEKHGHPPFYVLKPKSANKEVDVISTAETGRAGTSGGTVHMVTMKIGEHKGATFMSPKEIKLYFSA